MIHKKKSNYIHILKDINIFLITHHDSGLV